MTLVHRTISRTYRDSVALMALAAELQRHPAVTTAGAVMATPANAEILGRSGMWPEGLSPAPEDVLVVVDATDADAADTALDTAIRELLAGKGAGAVEERRPQTLADAFEIDPESTLVAVSTPGPYAAYVSRQALMAGRHVFCFSDNVPVADEVALKQLARSQGLLFMGPDCGTALIDGVPLGFVNVTQPGPVGILAAAGTGAQEVMCLLDAAGVGVAQVIGLGGRDLTAEVGGLMAEHALQLLLEDPEVEVVTLVSKPPAPEVAARLEALAADATKPVVLCLLGANDSDGTLPVRGTLLGGALAAAAAAGGHLDVDETPPPLPPSTGRVLGLYTGGSLAAEAKVVFGRAGLEKDRYTVIDLGDDEYTVGRPHPMIATELRGEWVEKAGSDPSVGVLLLDVVLGHGSNADPAGALVTPLENARAAAAADGRHLTVIASVTGTGQDPQVRSRQCATLLDAGVAVAPSNATAAAWAASCAGEVR